MDKEQIKRALAHADMRVLLMALFHITGDEKWISAPYLPKRDVRIVADEDCGFSEQVQADIRAAAAEILAGAAAPAITDPGNDLMQRMMSVCLGEAVPDEYAPMMREQLGFISPAHGITPPPERPRAPVVIVGAGVSGLALGHVLKGLGIPFTILEMAEDVGGTWWYNRYPGCAVDTPNHAYSFSFGSRYRWHSYFSPRTQLIDYVQGAADELNLRPHIQLGTKVTAARWCENKAEWEIDIERGDGSTETLAASALVSAVGQFNMPALPDIDGMDDFTGTMFHTARWPDGLDVKGKRVAIIGTGASAMQIVPSIADDVESLTIYQRSPQWARPVARFHDPIHEDAQWLMEHVPFYAAWFRFIMFWRYGDGLLPFLKKDPSWPHPERSLNRVNERHRIEMVSHIETVLKDRPDLIEKCLPTYPPYGKRILLDNGWFETLLKPGVELVTDGISRITETGVETVDGATRAADIIILSTGFQMGPMAAQLNITGRGGRALADDWAGDNPKGYLGITTHGYPNLFSMQGPNTGLGHGGSAIFQAEAQAHYIAATLAEMFEKDIAAIEPKQSAQDDYVARVDAEHDGLIWSHEGMTTYYRNTAGRIFSVMPWRLVDYWNMTRQPKLADYAIRKKA